MNASWPSVPLGEVATQRKEFILLDDDRKYRRVTVRLHAQGIVGRDEVSGQQVKTKKQYPLKAHDLLVAEIDAKMGGYGIVPKELEGAVVSSHYYTYEIDQSRLDLRFLDHWLRTPSPLAQIKNFIRGSLNYAAIRPYHVLGMQIPIPPIDIQRRIALQMDAVAHRVAEARSLQAAIADRHMEMLHAAYEEAALADSVEVLFGDLVEQAKETTIIDDGSEYMQLTVALNFRGVRLRDRVPGSSIKTKNQYVAHRGQLIYSRIDARNGAFGFVPDDLDGAVVTGDFPCFNVQRDRISPDVLWIVITRPEFVEACVNASRGVTNRRRMKEAQLCGIPVKLPGHAGQEQLRKLMRHVHSLGTLHAQILSDLESVMPSALHEAFGGEVAEMKV